jgi:hypothetical protein
MQYRTLTPNTYAQLVMQIISGFEGHEPNVRDIKDGMAGIHPILRKPHSSMYRRQHRTNSS